MSSMSGMSGMGGATGMQSGAGISGTKVPKGYQQGQLQQFTPDQMQLFQQMFGQLGPESFLGKLALRQFSELQGGLASRFSGMGSGARRSSGFQNTMSSAAGNFAEQLQSQRMGLQQQAIRDLMGMSGQLLGQRPYEQMLVEKQMPFWQQLTLGVGGGLAQGAGSALMGKFI